MNTSRQRQLTALPELKNTVDIQGRRHDWIAELIGISRFQLSHVLVGRRSLDEDKAIRLAALLGVPIFFLFEVPTGTINVPIRQQEAATS